MARPYDTSPATFQNPHNYPIVIPTPEGSSRRIEAGKTLVGAKGFYMACCSESSLKFVGDGTPADSEEVARVLAGKPPHTFPQTDPENVPQPPEIAHAKGRRQQALQEIEALPRTEDRMMLGKSLEQWVEFIRRAGAKDIRDAIRSKKNLKRLIEFLGVNVNLDQYESNRAIIEEIKTQLGQVVS